MLASNTILQKRYRVIRELGHGGLGTVYEALDQRVNCIVALKETLAGNDGETRSAFKREAALLGNLRHSALPKVMDFFSEDGGDFLVMEFIPGYDLAELLELRGSPFPQAQVIRWADDLLKVLDYLHGQNPPILHRDIKPSNLKLTKQGEIFLLDFGLAKGAAGQIETLNPEVSANVAAVIHRGMAINRRQRPATASEMRKALRNAVEEDEQHAAEEEYRRAEESRERREEERRREAELGARQTQEERQREEGATSKLEEERRRKAEQRRWEQEAAARRDKAEAQRRDEAERQKQTEGSERTRAEEEVRRRPQEREHVEEPRADLATKDGHEIVTAGESLAERPARNRAVLFVAVGLIGVVALVLAGWFMLGRRNKRLKSATTLPAQLNQPAKPTEDPTPPTGMVYVPGGTFMMGRDNADDEAERPAHQVNVKPVFIDAYEVTNEDYAKFVNATNHQLPLTWSNGSYQPSDARKPVTGVTWDDANAYAEWAKKRLPTEEEWEFAARGTDGRIYPWGNDWRLQSANANGTSQSMANVGSFKSASPFGAFDMNGNAWEWTASDLRAYPGGRLPANLPAGDLKVIRGGSFESTKASATATYRTGWPARGARTYAQTGFRCARDVAQ